MTDAEALQAIIRVYDEGTDCDGWDIGILEGIWDVLREHGLVTDDEPVDGGMAPLALLQHHLQHNLFPPLDVTWVPVAETAIDGAERGAYETLVSTPVGSATVRQVMESLHLWDFATDRVD